MTSGTFTGGTITGGSGSSGSSITIDFQAPRRKFGWIRDLPDVRDLRIASPLVDPASIPVSVDLRAQDSPIRDQGQEGSCTAFAIEGHFHIEVKKQGLTDFLGSPQFIYWNERRDQGTIQSDSGASIRESVKTCVYDGVAPEKLWPYSMPMVTKPSDAAYTEAVNHKVTQYLSLAQDLTTLQGCLAAGYPFVFGISVYQSFESSQVAVTGVVPMPTPGERLLGGHALVAVGYDQSRSWFIVRNSWGTGFGDKGYIYIPFAYLINPQLAADFWTLRTVTGPAPTPSPTPTPTPVTKVHQIDIYSDGSYKAVA